MSVDRTKFVAAAGQYVGDGGDVKICACDLEGRRILVIGGEYAGSKGSKLEGLFGDDAIGCQPGACDHQELKDEKGGEEESCTVCGLALKNFEVSF